MVRGSMLLEQHPLRPWLLALTHQLLATLIDNDEEKDIEQI